MSQSTIDSEIHEILNQFLYWANLQEDSDVLVEAEFEKTAHTITNLIAQEANKARLQTALNFATHLKLEFTKRDLSSDKMPDGYRKMTNEELITKVWGELTADKEQA